jgi:hypothetical protein
LLAGKVRLGVMVQIVSWIGQQAFLAKSFTKRRGACQGKLRHSKKSSSKSQPFSPQIGHSQVESARSICLWYSSWVIVTCPHFPQVNLAY